MTQASVWKCFAATIASLIPLMLSSSADAQIIRAPLNDGFARSSSISMNMDEMLGTRKLRAADEPIIGPGAPALWVAEVQFKPMRLMRLQLRDPKTGKMVNELVRYMVWRSIRRDYTELAGADQENLRKKLQDPERDPSVQYDPESAQPIRMPRFTLVTQEKDGTPLETYVDEVDTTIQNAVFRREMGRRGDGLKLFNSIEGIGEIGEPVPSADPDALDKAVYGVAVWRNVDPAADFLAVYMSGFCNSYRITTDAAGKRLVEEKVVVQRFARPGDEFRQDEIEFRLLDDGDSNGDGKPDFRYPTWEYRARSGDLDIADLETVLRNSPAAAAP